MAEAKVTLESAGIEYPFTITHAQRILSSKNNTLNKAKAFTLNDDKYTLKDGIITKRGSDKRTGSKPTTSGTDPES